MQNKTKGYYDITIDLDETLISGGLLRTYFTSKTLNRGNFSLHQKLTSSLLEIL